MIGFDDWKNKKSVTGYDSWKHEKVKSAKAVKPISSEPDDEDVYDLAASLLTQTQSKPATAPAAPRMSALDRGYGGVDTSKRATSVNDLSRDDLRVKSALGAAASGVGSGYSNALSTLMDAAEALENKYRVAYAPDTHIAQERSFISKPLDAEASRKKNETAIQILRNKADELSAKSEAQTESAKEGLGWLGKTAVDVGVTGTQMLSDAAAAALTGGGSALVPMAVRVFGQGAQEARQSGANLQKQIGYGAASAAVEVATEKLWGGLAGLYGKGFNDDAAKAVVKNFAQKVTTRPAGQAAIMLLADMGGEGMEEIISGAINPALQSIYNGKSVRENYADMDIPEVAYEGFIGAILGGIGGAVELPGNYADAQVTASGKAIDAYYEAVSKHGTSSNEAKTALASAKAAISRTEKNARQYSPPVRSDDVLRTAAMEVAAAQDERDGEQTMAERLVQPSNASLEVTVPLPSKDTQGTVATVRNATYNDTGADVQVDGISSVEDGTLYVSLDDGGTASLSDVTFDDPDVNTLYGEATKYNTQGAKALIENYDGSTDVSNYARAYASVYNNARDGLDYETAALSSFYAQNYLSQGAREAAYAAGLNAQKSSAAFVGDSGTTYTAEQSAAMRSLPDDALIVVAQANHPLPLNKIGIDEATMDALREANLTFEEESQSGSYESLNENAVFDERARRRSERRKSSPNIESAKQVAADTAESKNTEKHTTESAESVVGTSESITALASAIMKSQNLENTKNNRRAARSAARKQIRILTAISKKYNTPIILEENLTYKGKRTGGGGYYDYVSGEIHISASKSNGSILYIVMHELTHKLKRTDSEAYAKFKGIVLDNLKNNQAYRKGTKYAGDTLEARIESVTSTYKINMALSSLGSTEAEIREGAIEEIVCDASGVMLSDEAFVRALIEQDATLAERVLSFLNDFFEELQKSLKAFALKNGSVEYRALKEQSDTILEMIMVFNGAMENSTSDKAVAKGDSETGTKYMLNRSFVSEYDAWDGKDSKHRFYIGKTSEKLHYVGVDNQNIIWDASKIIKIKSDHPAMTDAVIKQVPNVIEDPIIIMKSRTVQDSITLFGELDDANGHPVLVALALRPTSDNNIILDLIKVASAYGKDSDPQQLLNESRILYVEADKKRADTWLKLHRLQLPSSAKYGLNGRIAYKRLTVKNSIRKNGENDAQTASYTDERITSLMSRYGSSNPAYSKAYVAYISPTDFISLTTTNPDKIAARTKPLDEDELRGETQEMFLQFDQDTGEVTGHEGRHRMQALMNEGIKRVAITLIPDDEKGRYDRKRIANVKLTGQQFNDRVASGKVTIDEALPLSKEYEQEVRAKFSQDGAVKFSIKERDAEYLAAVEHGDTETAQKMVDAAAKESGDYYRAYHGSNALFNVFSEEKLGSKNFMASSAHKGFFAAASKETAENYTGLNSMDTMAMMLNSESRADMDSLKAKYGYDAVYEKMKANKEKFDEDWKSSHGYYEAVTRPIEFIADKVKEAGILTTEDKIAEFVDSLKTSYQYDWYSAVYDAESGMNNASQMDADFDASEYSQELKALEEKIMSEWTAHEIKRKGFTPNIKNLYVKIRKPFVYDYQMHERDVSFSELMDKAAEQGCDGCIFKNVEDGGTYDTIYTVFSSNQMKSADPVTYDDNGNVILLSKRFDSAKTDIRFSMQEPIEEKDGLIAVHNLSSEQLERSLELGGFPMPSIAVVKAAAGHDKYGDISIVFDKKTIDPKSLAANEVYGGDAYTPVFPHIEYKINETVSDAITSRIYALRNKTGHEFHVLTDSDNAKDKLNMNDGDPVQAYKDDAALMALYLDENGLTYDVPKHEVALVRDGDPEENGAIIAASDAMGEIPYPTSESMDEAAAEKLRGLLNKWYDENFGDTSGLFNGDAAVYPTKFKWYQFRKYVDAINSYRERGVQYKSSRYDVEDTVRAAIEPHKSDYMKWLKNLLSGFVEKAGIRNDVDLFTASGNRRGFDALHYDVTLENIVKAMKKQEKVGLGALGTRSIHGAATKKFGSIKEIKNDANRLNLMPDEEYEKLHSSYTDRFSAIANKYAAGKDMWDAADTLVEATVKRSTVDGIFNYINQWKDLYHATKEIAQELYDLVEEMKQQPTGYFEAKPRRAVALDEIRLAVLPSDKYSNLKGQLRQRGITVEEYDESVDGDRLRALNSEPAKGLRFSISSVPSVTDAQIKQLTDENKRLAEALDLVKQEFKLTKGHTVSMKSLDKLAGKLLKTWKSSYDRETLGIEMKVLFDYIANTETPMWEDIQQYGVNLARAVLEKSSERDNTLYEASARARDYLRDTPIRLNDTQLSEVTYGFESYGAYRSSLFGKVNLSQKNGSSLDSVWQELSSLFPDLFDRDVAEGDQPLALYNAAMLMYERPISNPFGYYDMKEASYDLFLQIYDAYFDIPEVKTFADKKANELSRTKAKYRAALVAAREKSKEKYNNKLKALRAENVAARKKLSDEYKALLEQEKTLMLMVEGRARNEEQKKAAEQIAAEKARLKEQYKKLSDRKNEQLIEQRARFQEWKVEDRAHRAQKAEAKRLRAKITNRANELRKMLASPKLKEGKYVPDFLREPVIELLSGLDFTGEQGGVGAQTKWHSAMTRLYEEYKNYALAHSPDSSTQQLATNAAKYMNIQLMIHEAFLPIFQDFLESSKKVGDISNLSNAELKQLETLLNGVYANIRDVNRLYKNRRFANADIAGDAAIAYSENIRGTKDWRYLNSIRRFLSIDMLDSFSWGARMGEAGESIINELSTGLEKSYTRIREASEFFEQLKNRSGVKDSDIQSWTVATHNITLESGKTIVMSTAQLMEFYALCNRPQAMQHILKGGIEIDDIKQASKLIQQKGSYSITENDVSSLVGLLSEKQRGLIDGMQKFMSTQVAGWGNETTQELYMTDMYREPKYWTIRASRSSINTEDPAQIRAFNAVMNSSFTKSTNKYAGNPITIGDAFQTFGDHISGMAVYNGLALPIDDAMKWLNYRQRDEDGAIVQNANTKLAIDNVLGNAGQQYLINLIKDLNGLNSSGYSVQLSNKLLSNFKKASVAGKLRVVVQQPVSIFRALSEIDGRYLLAATFKRHSIDEMQKYAPIAWWKSKGNYEIGTGRSLRSVIIGDDTAYQKFVNGAMQPAGLADDATWAHIWEAAKLEVREKNKDLTGEAYMEKVAERFSSIVNRTQVVDTIMHRSQAMRSQDTAVKQATAFMSEPTKTYNMLLNAAFAVANSKGPAKAAALKRLAKVAAAWVLTETAHAAVLALHDSLRDRDDEESILDKWLESFAKNVKDGINPLDLIPYVRDVVSAIDGYDSSNMETEAIGEIVDAVRAWNKFFAGEGSKTPYGLASASVKAISDLTGAPFGGLLASAEAIINGIAPGTLAKKEDTSVSAHVENLYAAHVAGREKQMSNALDSISEIYSKKLADKVKEGKTYVEAQKEARSSVLTSCNRILKPLYLEAETTAEKIAIRTLAYRIRIGNQQLYKGYDFNRNWK